MVVFLFLHFIYNSNHGEFNQDKQDMEKRIKRNLYYFKNQQKVIDAQKTKAEMASLRRNSIKLQKIIKVNMIEYVLV